MCRGRRGCGGGDTTDDSPTHRNIVHRNTVEQLLDFYGCPSAVPFTQLVAQDGPGFKARRGPTSILPPDRNQVLIEQFDLSEQYLLHVDSTRNPFKVLSCSKAPLTPPANQTQWALDYAFGLIFSHARFDAMEPCPGAPSGSRDCQRWRSASTSQAGCLDNKTFTAHQELQYLIAPTAESVAPSTPFSVSRFTNDLHYPPNMPKICHGDTGDHNWWHTNWSSFSPSPGPEVFAVPADCPPAASAQALLASFKGGAGRQ